MKSKTSKQRNTNGAGKGDKPRVSDYETYRKNFDKIFGNKKDGSK